MYKNIMGTALFIAVSGSLLLSATDAQKYHAEVPKKAAKTFLTGFAGSAALNATFYSAALACLKSEHPYFGAACLAAATSSPWLAAKLVEQMKGSELTTKEAIQLGIADFFTNLAAGAFMVSSCEQGWVNKAFMAVCVAKFAHIFWWFGQLPSATGEDIDLGEQLPTHVPPTPIQAPQEIPVVVPVAPKPKPKPEKVAALVVQPKTTAAVPDSSNYPWMGGEKPNHQDAFMLLGN